MKRKAGGQAANSPDILQIPVSQQSLDHRNSSISSSQSSINSISDQQRRQQDYEVRVRKSLDLTHLVNYLRELCNQEESESESESSDNGTSYFPSSPLSGLLPGGIHNNSSTFGLLRSEEIHNQTDGFGRSMRETSAFGPADLLNENSSSTISDDHLRYNSNQSRAASKVGTAMFNSAPVSLISSARSSINGSVTTKSSYSSSNSTLSDEDSSQRLGNESHDSSSDDEHNSDSDIDSALPISDADLTQLFEAGKSFSNVGFAAGEQASINFVEALNAASRKGKRKPGKTKSKFKKLFGGRKGTVRHRINKKSLALKTEQTIAGAMSTFKTPKNFSSGKVAPAIKLDPLEHEMKTAKVKSEPLDTPSPAKRRRKKLSPGSNLDDTSSLNEQIMDVNTSQSTASLDSYFRETEKKMSVSTKARSTSSTSSLDKFSLDYQGLKSKRLSPQRKLELLNLKRKRIYILICKRDIPKAYKNRLSIRNEKIAAKRRLGFTATGNTQEAPGEKAPARVNLAPEPFAYANAQAQQTLTFHSAQECTSKSNEVGVRVNDVVKFCQMGARQKLLYNSLEAQIRERLVGTTSDLSDAEAEVIDKKIFKYLATLRMVCNHSELICPNEVRSPFRHQLNVFYPKLVFTDALDSYRSEFMLFASDRSNLCIYHPSNVHASFFPKVQIEDLNMTGDSSAHSEWSFLKFIGTHLSQLYGILFGKFGTSLQHIRRFAKSQQVAHHQKLWQSESGYTLKSTINLLLIDHERVMSCANIAGSPLLSKLYLAPGVSSSRNSLIQGNEEHITSDIPRILHCYCPQASTERMKVYFRRGSKSIPGTSHWSESIWLSDACTDISETLGLDEETTDIWDVVPNPGFSQILIPKKSNTVSDAGKLLILEELLESCGSRVLILSQTPEMIELLDGYLKTRKWSRTDNFVRLSLTSQLNELSEKISTPAFDAIIVYDGSWVEELERLALKRIKENAKSGEVSLYRLICKGTIEEAMLEPKLKQDQDGVGSEEKLLPGSSIISAILENKKLSREDLRKQIEAKIRLRAESKQMLTETIDKSKNGKEYEKVGHATLNLPQVASAQTDNESDKEMDAYGDEYDSSQDEDSGDDDEDKPLSAIAKTLSKNLTSNSLDFESSDDELALLPKPRKISRGMGKRGRPPTRIRFRHRDYDGRRPGRPRLKPYGPQNQAIRGRGPGRPPLTRKVESFSAQPTPAAVPADHSVFEYHSSPEPDSS